MVTRTGFEPVLPPWKGGVLTAWPTGHSLKIWRRARDLNPRDHGSGLHDFQSCSFGQLGQLSIKMAPAAGFEPATDRLTADCSTTELRWNTILPTVHEGEIYWIAWQRPTLAGDKPQLPSALESLTSEFGMESGVASLPLSPD